MECKTYRYRGHSRFEPASYRGKDELERWQKKDPISSWKNHLIEEMKVEEQILDGIDADVQRVIEEAVAFAETSSDPEPSAYRDYIFK